MWKVFKKFKDHMNPKNKLDSQVEKRLYSELRKLGYNFFDSVQFDCFTFKSQDKKVVPILIKYIEQFEQLNYKLQFIGALGVKGFDNATEYLITQYKKNLPPNYNQFALNVIAQTLARVCDLRYLDTYFEFLEKDVTIDACYIIQMLGKQKVNRAVPYLIKLLDCIAIIPKEWEGTVLEDQKYFVSQSAIAALGKFKDFAYNGYIEKFLYPEQLGWIDFKESKDRKQLLKSTYLEYKQIAQKAMMK